MESPLPEEMRKKLSSLLLPVVEAIAAAYMVKKVQDEVKKSCTVCGVPLILKSEDKDGDHADEPEVYEDENGGLCGSCHMAPKGVNKF
jgi:hypothetical protein